MVLSDEPFESEIWREIPDLPGYYISSAGRARGPRGIISCAERVSENSKFPYPHFMARGRCVITHREVAKLFIFNDDPETQIQVDHINGDKSDNRVDNLDWVSRETNMHRMMYRVYLEDSEGQCHRCTDCIKKKLFKRSLYIKEE